MVLRYIKEFNELFIKEINSRHRVKLYRKEITKREINMLHAAVIKVIINQLFDYFPTRINFGKYFFIYSRNQKTFYEIQYAKPLIFERRKKDRERRRAARAKARQLDSSQS